MWFWITVGVIVLSLIIFCILYYKIEQLEQEKTKIKCDYEDKILIILNEIKEIESKYATTGTDTCKYLDNAIACHNKSYHHYKNKLNIDTLSENV